MREGKREKIKLFKVAIRELKEEIRRLKLENKLLKDDLDFETKDRREAEKSIYA